MKSHLTSTMQERERALLERVRSGDCSPHALVLFLQPHVTSLALRLASGGYWPSLEWRDLASSANVVMLERIDRALTRENPFSYLVKVAKHAMFDVLRALHPIDAPSLVSLDAPTGEGEEPLIDTIVEEIRLEPAHARHEERDRVLVQSLDRLKPKQRTVLIRHYGIGEHAPEPLNVIGRDMSKSGCASASHYQHKQGLSTLRSLLAPSFPQYCAGREGQA